MSRDAAVAVLAALLAAFGLRGGDPAAAEALWQHAMVESGGALTHDLFIDATRENARLRPWQPGFSVARDRIRAVGEARRTH